MILPARRRPPVGGWLALACIAWLLTAAGCGDGHEPNAEGPQPSSSSSRPALRIRLAVVDDPTMAAAIRQLAGQWEAHSGDRLEVQELTLAAFHQADSLDADAVIYPSRYLGRLVQRNWIAPVQPELLKSTAYRGADVLPLARAGEPVWGERPMALPLGSPVLTLYYRADLLEKLRRRPPTTWAEYQKLAAQLNDRKNLGDAAPPADQPWCGAIEPLAPGWASRTLLARAAAYAKHRSHYSTLFRVDTFEPLIDGPPFVRALDELLAVAKLSGAPPTDPTGARHAIHAGHCAMALSWPTPTERTSPENPVRLGFAELPGSRDVYDIGAGSWETRPADRSDRVTLLDVAGRLGSVTRSPSNYPAALRLLAWLSGPKMSVQVSTASPATTLFRKSQATAPLRWVEAGVDAAAALQYADSITHALAREAWLLAPRIPAADDYMAALDAAVEQARAGKASSQDALHEAARRWREITKQHGLDAQRAAYRQSLGL